MGRVGAAARSGFGFAGRSAAGHSPAMSCTRASMIVMACAALSVACDNELSATLDSGLGSTPLQEGPTLRLNVAGDVEAFACGAGFTADEVRADQVDAVT